MTSTYLARNRLTNAKFDANLANEELRKALKALESIAKCPEPVQYLINEPSYSYKEHRVHEDGSITICLDNKSNCDDRYIGNTVLREWIDMGYYISAIDSTIYDNIMIKLSKLRD